MTIDEALEKEGFWITSVDCKAEHAAIVSFDSRMKCLLYIMQNGNPAIVQFEPTGEDYDMAVYYASETAFSLDGLVWSQ